jgi:hypothetical protein
MDQVIVAIGTSQRGAAAVDGSESGRHVVLALPENSAVAFLH